MLIRALFIKRGEPDTHYVKSADKGYVRIINPLELYRKKGKRANWAYDRINEGSVYQHHYFGDYIVASDKKDV